MLGFENLDMLVAPRAELHWSPCPAEGSTPACADCFLALCREAEACGVASLHVPISNDLSSALQLAAVGAAEVARLHFRIGGRFDDVLASLRGTDLVDVARSTGGRLVVHMAFEDSAAAPDFRSAAEFIAACRALFHQSPSPAFEIEGQSALAAGLAIRVADCLWRRPSPPPQAYADALPVWHLGKEVGLHAPANTEALEAARIAAYRQRGFARFLLREQAPGVSWNDFRDGLLPAIRRGE